MKGAAERRRALVAHVEALKACRRCPAMHPPSVSGGPVDSDILLVGQAPGDKEPVMGRPFAWTAGKTMFRWFEEQCGVNEANFRNSVYMAAVCRCFPGKKPKGGDRVPAPDEIERCGKWLDAEFRLLRPRLVLAVGKLAICEFMPPQPLVETIGKTFRATRVGVDFDFIPLPHPSGASPWHRMEPGRTLLRGALARVAAHPAWRERFGCG
ncbi:MAG TPA: uracil-DNA glycosylase family protein [Chthoniobacteraceae bacterium]|nr:uracil-DNA glycosylase family protein [Chthoniobacteraceae bacterium]